MRARAIRPQAETRGERYPRIESEYGHAGIHSNRKITWAKKEKRKRSIIYRYGYYAAI